MNNLWQTILIVLAVVMIFLGWRLGLIVGAMVPLVMLLSILVMRYLDIELERMSLATLIIALGLLVDNGIVVAEEISRRLGLGEDRLDAALAAGKSMAVPLLSSSLTTIFAFMPLMLADSAAGEYTRSISLVIAIALLGSWTVAVTVTPLFGYWFAAASKTVSEDQQFSGRFFQLYRQALTWMIRLRWLAILAVVGLLVLAVWAFQFVPKVFFPASERTQLQILVDLPVGANTYATESVARQLINWLNDKEANPEVVNHVAYIASGGPRFYLALNPIDPDPNRAYFIVNLANPQDVVPMIARTRAFALTQLPEARVQPKPMSMGPGRSRAGPLSHRRHR